LVGAKIIRTSFAKTMTAQFREAALSTLPLPRIEDLSALEAALAAAQPAAHDVVAVLAKTQGDGGPKDRSRKKFVAAATRILARHLGIAAGAVAARVAFVVSGGIEASAAPHMVVLSRRYALAGKTKRPALAIAHHVSQPIAATMLGDARLIAAAAVSVRAALGEAKLGPRDTHLVLIKGPAGEGAEGISRARAATALGACVALGEFSLAAATRAWRNRDLTRWSARVAVSSAAEFPCFEVVALGHSKAWVGDLRIAHRAMADWVDLPAVVAALGDLSLSARPQLSRNDAKRLVATIAKGGPPADEILRGVPLGLSADPSQPAFRRVRGALAGTIVAATGVPFAFVSGGAEHQGPPGGGLVAFVARVKQGRTTQLRRNRV
jgi:cyanuric acid amidohydrolase